MAFHQVLFEPFSWGHRRQCRSTRLVLDFDATDTRLHSEQEDQFFHSLLRWLLLFAVVRVLWAAPAGELPACAEEAGDRSSASYGPPRRSSSNSRFL